MNVVNLTPHAINIYRDGLSGPELAITIEPSGEVARCTVEREETAQVSFVNGQDTRISSGEPGVVFYATKYGKVTGLADPDGETVYIVSLLVKQACPDRQDLTSPGELLRNEAGQPIGCYGLTR